MAEERRDPAEEIAHVALGQVLGVGVVRPARRKLEREVQRRLATELVEGLGTRVAEETERFEAGVRDGVAKHGLPWSVSRLGARTEYRFADPAPRNGTESAASADGELEDFLHLFMANRSILMTPFHNMALMCPATTEADVDTHTAVFAEALAELVG